ncbi:MAG: hypothetical protein SH820_06650 [Xanthomonadales bacterium]|nr:hypothetical protein [Xanthomonadales bacterium]
MADFQVALGAAVIHLYTAVIAGFNHPTVGAWPLGHYAGGKNLISIAMENLAGI